MQAKTLKKKYPDFWDSVETNVFNDMSNLFETHSNNDSDPEKKLHTVAYNAAFFATHEHYKVDAVRTGR